MIFITTNKKIEYLALVLIEGFNLLLPKVNESKKEKKGLNLIQIS